MASFGSSEPYNAKALEGYLLANGAEQYGTHGPFALYRVNGNSVKCSTHGSDTVPTFAARQIAGALGKTYAELRDEIGHPVIRPTKGKPKAVAKRAEKHTTTRRDALETIARIRQTLADTERLLKQGQRDSAFYHRVRVRLVDVQRQADEALSEAKSQGVRHAS